MVGERATPGLSFLKAIVAADDEVAQEEQIAFDEASAVLQNYLKAR